MSKAPRIMNRKPKHTVPAAYREAIASAVITVTRKYPNVPARAIIDAYTKLLSQAGSENPIDYANAHLEEAVVAWKSKK